MIVPTITAATVPAFERLLSSSVFDESESVSEPFFESSPLSPPVSLFCVDEGAVDVEVMEGWTEAEAGDCAFRHVLSSDKPMDISSVDPPCRPLASCM